MQVSETVTNPDGTIYNCYTTYYFTMPSATMIKLTK